MTRYEISNRKRKTLQNLNGYKIKVSGIKKAVEIFKCVSFDNNHNPKKLIPVID